MAASDGDAWKDIGRCRFNFATRTIESKFGFQSLGKLEAQLVELLISAAGRFLPADKLVSALWPDDKADARVLRQRLDSLKIRLNKKLALIGLGDLIENRHGTGYRIAVPSAQPGITADYALEFPKPLPRTKRVLSYAEFARLLSVLEDGSLVFPYSRMIIQSSRPIVLYKGGYDRLIANLRLGVRVDFLMGANEPDAIGRLVQCLCQPALRELARHDDEWNLILNQVRIVVLPLNTSPEHLYILNAESSESALLYCCDFDPPQAVCREGGLKAHRYGECLQRLIPPREETLINFTPHCANPTWMREEVRAAVLFHLDPALHGHLHRVLPEAPLKKPVASTPVPTADRPSGTGD